MSAQLYYPNTLQPSSLDVHTLSLLEDSILAGIQLIEQNTAPAGSDSHENLYTGHSGIAWAYCRIWYQLPHLESKIKFEELIRKHQPRLHRHEHSLHAGKLSPIGTPTGAAFMGAYTKYIMSDADDGRWEKAMITLEFAVGMACASDEDGGDEVLYGRAGLLWALLNLQKLDPAVRERMQEWEGGEDIVKVLVQKIIDAGRRGRIKAKKEHNLNTLMWEWHDKMYLGAMHGAAGILTVLLQVPRETIEPFLPEILTEIAALCHLALENNGLLPSSLGAQHRSNPHVQICHGSPGLVLLLTTLRQRFPANYNEYAAYSHALHAAAKKVWEQGLVKKGLGICHGVGGNGWVLLMLAQGCGREEKEKWLGRALALLVEAGKMPPIGDQAYRKPDAPFSLYEGVAGTLAAWAEAYVVLDGLLDGKNWDEGAMKCLGFVGLGGRGPTGLF